jgi:hypothetical protein
MENPHSKVPSPTFASASVCRPSAVNACLISKSGCVHFWTVRFRRRGLVHGSVGSRSCRLMMVCSSLVSRSQPLDRASCSLKSAHTQPLTPPSPCCRPGNSKNSSGTFAVRSCRRCLFPRHRTMDTGVSRRRTHPENPDLELPRQHPTQQFIRPPRSDRPGRFPVLHSRRRAYPAQRERKPSGPLPVRRHFRGLQQRAMGLAKTRRPPRVPTPGGRPCATPLLS